jgi:intracellular multiplication protein IcmG
MTKRQTLGDDEYQFPSEEYIAPEETSSEEATPELEHPEPEEPHHTTSVPGMVLEKVKHFALGHKKAVIVTGLCVLGFISFHVLRHPAPQPVVQKPAPVVQAPVQPQPVMQQPAQLSDQAVSQLNSLNQAESTATQQIMQLQGQVSDLKNQLTQANVAQNALTEDVNTLRNQVGGLLDQVRRLQKQLKAKDVAVPPIVYHLQAIVMGRAWLVGSDGSTDTVSVGDKLKNYGTVLSVDLNQGKVVTSSGKTIGYGADDR